MKLLLNKENEDVMNEPYYRIVYFQIIDLINILTIRKSSTTKIEPIKT